MVPQNTDALFTFLGNFSALSISSRSHLLIRYPVRSDHWMHLGGCPGKLWHEIDGPPVPLYSTYNGYRCSRLMTLVPSTPLRAHPLALHQATQFHRGPSALLWQEGLRWVLRHLWSRLLRPAPPGNL